MAETLERYKSKPVATTLTALALIATNHTATMIVHACNQAAAVDTIRIAHIDGGVGDIAAEDYIVYDFPLEASGVLDIAGIAAKAGDTIAVYSTNGTTSFQAWSIDIQ